MNVEELKNYVDSKRSNIILNKGISSLGLLGTALVVLKALGYINWSWWLVFAPFYIPFIIGIILLLFILVSCIYICNMEIEDTTIEKTVKKEPKKKPKKKANGEEGNKGTEKKND